MKNQLLWEQLRAPELKKLAEKNAVVMIPMAPAPISPVLIIWFCDCATAVGLFSRVNVLVFVRGKRDVG